MVEINIFENAHMPTDDRDFPLKLLLIERDNDYYEIAISKDMKTNYIRLIRDIIKRGASERLQFSVHVNCKESTINIFKEHTITDREKGVGWSTEEEWNFRGVNHQTCSWVYKLINQLRIELLLIREDDKQHAVEMAEELERYMELLIELLEREEAEEIVYCKNRSKFIVNTHTSTFEWFFDDSNDSLEETTHLLYN